MIRRPEPMSTIQAPASTRQGFQELYLSPPYEIFGDGMENLQKSKLVSAYGPVKGSSSDKRIHEEDSKKKATHNWLDDWALNPSQTISDSGYGTQSLP